MPQGPQSPGGFANGIFNGGGGNFGPAPIAPRNFSGGAGTGYGVTSYQNDASGEVAAGFGIGTGNSGNQVRQTGRDTRGFAYQQ